MNHVRLSVLRMTTHAEVDGIPVTHLKDSKPPSPKTKGGPISDDHPLIKSPRSHLEMDVVYTVTRPEGCDFEVPLDASALRTYCFHCLPTSRGSVPSRVLGPQRRSYHRPKSLRHRSRLLRFPSRLAHAGACRRSSCRRHRRGGIW